MKTLCSLALIALLAAGGVHAACAYPDTPKKLPRGKTATLDEMMAAQKAVKEFDAAINEYVSCLQVESDAAVAQIGARQSDPKKAEDEKNKLVRVLIKKQNAAIDADKALAARFNEQLKIFKARNAEKS
jgi:hypothetical protein